MVRGKPRSPKRLRNGPGKAQKKLRNGSGEAGSELVWDWSEAQEGSEMVREKPNFPLEGGVRVLTKGGLRILLCFEN